MPKLYSSLLLLCLAFSAIAQNTAEPTVDVMRSNGKIYVVMAVVLIIMIGFFTYLYTVDKKITKLEKQHKL